MSSEIVKSGTTTMVLGFAAQLVIPAFASAQSTTVHNLSVRSFGPGTFTNATADAMFDSANNGVLTDEDPTSDNDFACNHALARSGNVVANAMSPSPHTCTKIDTTAEMLACAAEPGFVKIVDIINVCLGNVRQVGFIGCQPAPLSSVVLERNAAASVGGGAILNHEFGHAVGLCHHFEAESGWDVRVLIMNWAVDATSRWLPKGSCPAFMINNPNPGIGCNGMSQGTGGDAQASDGKLMRLAEAAADLSQVPIERLARSFFMDRDPIEAADFYTQGDVDKLVAMLRDPANAPYRKSISALIAIISQGQASHTQALLDVASSKDRTDSAAYGAILGLGMVAQKGSARALQFLLEHAEDSDPDRADQAIAGLGLSAEPEAIAKLHELRTRAKGARVSVLDDAIKDHAVVVRRGILGHYGR
jgi:hypothetical protein